VGLKSFGSVCSDLRILLNALIAEQDTNKHMHIISFYYYLHNKNLMSVYACASIESY